MRANPPFYLQVLIQYTSTTSYSFPYTLTPDLLQLEHLVADCNVREYEIYSCIFCVV